MKHVHIWKPEDDRWIVIDTFTGQLFDVTGNIGRWVINSCSGVDNHADVIAAVIYYEKISQASQACGHNSTHNLVIP